MSRSEERAALMANARRMRAEIEQMFIDAAHWNRSVRKPDEDPVDPDPYGEMRALAAALDEHLTNDPGFGPIAPLKFERRH